MTSPGKKRLIKDHFRATIPSGGATNWVGGGGGGGGEQTGWVRRGTDAPAADPASNSEDRWSNVYRRFWESGCQTSGALTHRKPVT